MENKEKLIMNNKEQRTKNKEQRTKNDSMIGSKLSTLAIKHIETVHNGYVVNVIESGKNGTPDLLACINGKFFAFEIKGMTDTKKRLQDEAFKRIKSANGYGGYVYHLKDIDDIVLHLRKPEVPKEQQEILDL